MTHRIVGVAALLALVAATGCGGGEPVGTQLAYTDPAAGALRLIRDPESPGGPTVVLALIVGAQPLTGYAAGFDLPLDAARVKLAAFTPGTALDPGQPPLAAQAVIPADGPLAGVLVAVQSQKASGAGAVPTDATLAPGAVLYTVQLELVDGATQGVVFDGSASGFALPSGGLRTRGGTAMVDAAHVGIGRLEVR